MRFRVIMQVISSWCLRADPQFTCTCDFYVQWGVTSLEAYKWLLFLWVCYRELTGFFCVILLLSPVWVSPLEGKRQLSYCLWAQEAASPWQPTAACIEMIMLSLRYRAWSDSVLTVWASSLLTRAVPYWCSWVQTKGFAFAEKNWRRKGSCQESVTLGLS